MDPVGHAVNLDAYKHFGTSSTKLHHGEHGDERSLTVNNIEAENRDLGNLRVLRGGALVTRAMRLLVSVATAAEAAAALAGGADVIDAKDPLVGALGAVSLEVLREIHALSAARRPMTAALGDAADEAAIERVAFAFAEAGAVFVKVGFGGVVSADRVASLAAAAVCGAEAGSHRQAGVVAVAYADADRAASLPPACLLEIASRAGARGVLLDTADKNGPGLRALLAQDALARWVADAHGKGLLVALAGKLTSEDLPFIQHVGADIAGVRGAACVGGRAGLVAADKVRQLRALLDTPDLETREGLP